MRSHSRVFLPSTSTSPASGASSPLASLSTVVFPPPLVPTSATVSPASTARLKPSRMVAWREYPTETSRKSIPFIPCQEQVGQWAAPHRDRRWRGEFPEQCGNELGDGRMNVHRSLEDVVRRLGVHRVQHAVD